MGVGHVGRGASRVACCSRGKQDGRSKEDEAAHLRLVPKPLLPPLLPPKPPLLLLPLLPPFFLPLPLPAVSAARLLKAASASWALA